LDDYFAVIMAGGGGTRLWPLSRQDRPKQTLALFGDRSLFQMAVERVHPLIPMERLRIATIRAQVGLLREQVPALPADGFLIEPAPRGTASVVGLAAVTLAHEDAQAVMAVLTADHHIANETLLRSLLAAAYQPAKDGHLVTLGIEPTQASTGYGYLELGEQVGEVGGHPFHKVESFREKPDQQTAERYLAAGNYLWNSGMFVWRVDRILQEFDRHMPELAAGLARITEALGTSSAVQVVEQVWETLRSQTIDFGVMENADDVVVLPTKDLGWWDVGSWNRLYDVLPLDEQGNLVLAQELIALDTSGTLIVQEPGQSRLVATLGVNDLVIVDTGVVLLVTTRDRAEQVRALVDQLRQDPTKHRYL
jgi:mannose-1-phosphate guanylyltransferase